MKKFFVLSLPLILLLSACATQPRSAISDYDYSQMELVQLDAINGEIGENDENRPIAIITTSLGIIKIALYPEYAPNTVANFIERVEEGFYDNTSVLAVQDGVFFAGLNSEGEAKTSTGEPIENEYSVNMWPFRGAVGSYYGNTPGFGDSRFFIINEQELNVEQLEQLKEISVEYDEDGEPLQMLPDELIAAFEEVGCAVTLSGFFTIFGQTIEGIEIVEEITKSELDRQSRPTQEIEIVSIKIQ